MNNLLITINNYNFNNNANKLKNYFSNFFNTILIDSSSDEKPEFADLVIENNFYPGLWNESVKNAIEKNYEWLMFVASDINFLFPNFNSISLILSEIINNENIGIYCPSVSHTSRCSFKDILNKSDSNDIRDINFVEGFLFLARTKILKYMYPIDYKINKYGWSLDIIMCDIARKMKYRVVTDDRICIYHPKSIHTIDTDLALSQGKAYSHIIRQQQNI